MKIHYVLGVAALLALPVAQAADAPAKPMAKQEQSKQMMMQDPAMPPCGMMADCPDDEAQKELKLTDEQKKQLQAIKQDARAKHETIRNETQAKIKSVLTPEQYKKHEEMRAKRMERRGDRMERRQEHMEQRKEKMKAE